MGRLPTQRHWIDVDWQEATEMGFLPPMIDFVEAEDLTRERDGETKREHSETRLRAD